VVRGELGQVAAVSPQCVPGGTGVGQVGEEVAGVPGEQACLPELVDHDRVRRRRPFAIRLIAR
jgi:hypothetical protein